MKQLCYNSLCIWYHIYDIIVLWYHRYDIIYIGLWYHRDNMWYHRPIITYDIILSISYVVRLLHHIWALWYHRSNYDIIVQTMIIGNQGSLTFRLRVHHTVKVAEPAAQGCGPLRLRLAVALATWLESSGSEWTRCARCLSSQCQGGLEDRCRRPGPGTASPIKRQGLCHQQSGRCIFIDIYGRYTRYASMHILAYSIIFSAFCFCI